MPKRSGSAADRDVRIADQVQRDLAELIQRKIKNPVMGLVMLQFVTLMPDYAHVKIYFAVPGAEPEVASTILNEKAGYPHSLLFKRLRIHTVSTLYFHFDGSVECGIGMLRLIDEANIARARGD